jgi:hypothetical protein
MYRVIAKDWIADLEEEISNMQLNGWKPTGGIAVAAFPNGVTKFYQAMIKNEFV